MLIIFYEVLNMKKKSIAACAAMAFFAFPMFAQAAEQTAADEQAVRPMENAVIAEKAPESQTSRRGDRKPAGRTVVVTEPDQRASVKEKRQKEEQKAEKARAAEEARKEKELQREKRRMEKEKKKAEKEAAKALAKENRRREKLGLPPLTPDDLLSPAEKAKKMHAVVNNPLIPADWGGDTIYGLSIATEEQCVKFLLERNPRPQLSVTPQELVHYYFTEGAREGIRGDVAFAQAMKETGYFNYGGTVTPDQNNYCGLGTTSSTVKGGYFPTAEIGVRAHIQHLLAYSSTRRPAIEIVDPRYELVRDIWGENCLTHWTDLNGRWAVPGHYYGESILEMFEEILAR